MASTRNFHALLVALAASSAADGCAADFSGSLALTSDYVFRGISQTGGAAALQLGGRLQAPSGAYAAVWASRVDYGAASSARAEVDVVLGWKRSLTDTVTADVGLTWFTYAGAPELDYVEAIGTVEWRQRAWLTVGISNDVFATGRTGSYAHAGYRMPVSDTVRIEAGLGRYGLDGAYGSNYTHGQLSGIRSLGAGLEARVTAHATSGARDIFGNPGRHRIEAALQLTF